ncbi:MAG: hypothetical protein AAGK97_07250, partial [Bacteroidota bacterium]
ELVRMDQKSFQLSNASNSILIGNASGLNSNGSNNIFLGNEAGRNAGNASNNIYFGNKAGNANTGQRNVILGNEAGEQSSGIDNVFIGYQAAPNTETDENVIIGTYAGSLNESGFDNTFIGNQSGFSNVSGHNNTYVGKDAGFQSNSGDWNTSLGNFAGRQNMTGNDNTNVGTSAGYSNASGSFNVNIGSRANINNTGSQNVTVGAFAGNFNNTGSGNVFLGYQAGYNETGSDKLYIANDTSSLPLLYGEFDNKKLIIRENLETYNPNNNEIAIYGQASGSGATAIRGEASNSSGTGKGGEFTSIATGGTGVIGKSLNGGPFINYGGFFEASGTQGRAVYGKALAGTGATNYGGYFESNGSSGTAVRGIAGGIGSIVNTGGHFTAFGASGRGVYAEATAGNGIGLLAKGAALAAFLDGDTDVKGDLEIQAKAFDANLYMKTNSGTSGKVMMRNNNSTDIHIGDIDGQGSELILEANGFENMRIAADRQVGIGTTSPNSRLHVNSAVGENPFRAQVNGTTRFYVHSNGGVAIGTTSTPPVEGLRIDGLSGSGVRPVKVDGNGNLIAGNTSYYIAINPMTFDARDNGSLAVNESFLQMGFFGVALSSVQLPHNAFIKSLQIRYTDSVNMNLLLRLKEIDFVSGNITTVATVQTLGTGGSGTRTTTLTTPYQINNQNSNYYLEVTTAGGLISDTILLECVHIEYGY